MAHEKTIQTIEAGKMTRGDMVKLYEKAKREFIAGKPDAESVMNAIAAASALDAFIVFMGFCPDSNFANRKDIAWKKAGVCRYDDVAQTVQMERFNSLYRGDLIVLKKRNVSKQTMELHGFGRVDSIAFDADGNRYLRMNWSLQERVITVPLMGCNLTVNTRPIEKVEEQMAAEFFYWLEAE